MPLYDEILEMYVVVDDAFKAITKAAEYGCTRMVEYPSFLLMGKRVSNTRTGKLLDIAQQISTHLNVVSYAWMGYEQRHLDALKQAMVLINSIFEMHDAYVAKLAADREDRAKWRMAEDYRVR